MRQQIVQYIINVLLIGISTRYNQANGFGFNFTPAAAPAIPLSVAANSPFPYPFAAPPCGAAPFCPPPTVIVAPPFGAPPPFYPPPYPQPYPPPYPPPYPYPPAPAYPYPPPDPYPKHTLFSSILNAILSKGKGNSMPQAPPSPMQNPPQQSRIQVHVVKDSGQDHKKQNYHHNHNHWREEKPKWN